MQWQTWAPSFLWQIHHERSCGEECKPLAMLKGKPNQGWSWYRSQEPFSFDSYIFLAAQPKDWTPKWVDHMFFRLHLTRTKFLLPTYFYKWLGASFASLQLQCITTFFKVKDRLTFSPLSLEVSHWTFLEFTPLWNWKWSFSSRGLLNVVRASPPCLRGENYFGINRSVSLLFHSMVTTEDGCANLARTDIPRLLFCKTEKKFFGLGKFLVHFWTNYFSQCKLWIAWLSGCVDSFSLSCNLSHSHDHGNEGRMDVLKNETCHLCVCIL